MLCVVSSILFGWSFTQKHFDNLTKEQLMIIKKSYIVGGLNIAALAVVETRAGKYRNDSKYICGAHQIDIRVAYNRFPFINKDNLCTVLWDYPALSAFFAREELKFWLTIRNFKGAIQGYNAGFLKTSHSIEYYRRFFMVRAVLKYNIDRIKVDIDEQDFRTNTPKS